MSVACNYTYMYIYISLGPTVAEHSRRFQERQAKKRIAAEKRRAAARGESDGVSWWCLGVTVLTAFMFIWVLTEVFDTSTSNIQLK